MTTASLRVYARQDIALCLLFNPLPCNFFFLFFSFSLFIGAYYCVRRPKLIRSLWQIPHTADYRLQFQTDCSEWELLAPAASHSYKFIPALKKAILPQSLIQASTLHRGLVTQAITSHSFILMVPSPVSPIHPPPLTPHPTRLQPPQWNTEC